MTMVVVIMIVMITELIMMAMNTFAELKQLTNFTHVFFTISGNYVAMEKEASVRCILGILNIKMWNECGISRQTGIQEKKLMRTDERFQDVLHQFDPWHALHKKCVYWESFWSAFFLHFPAFGPNTDRYSASLRIQSKCRKLREKCRREYFQILTLFTH